MPAIQTYVRRSEEIEAKLKETFEDKTAKKVILLLEGSTDVETGDSWNEDCCKVEGLLEPLLKEASENTKFLMVEVGNKEAWENEDNFFKKHATFMATAIPALLSFSEPTVVAKRLDGTACLDEKAVTELFA